MSVNRYTLVLALLLSLAALPVVQPAAAVPDAQRISERTYRQLTRAHALMEKQRYDEALASLDQLRLRVAHRPHELALVLQTYGHLYATQEKHPQAIAALTECLALEALPKSATAHTLYVLAQLQVLVADYTAAVATFEQLFQLQRDPEPAALALAGAAYARVQRYPEAIEQLGRAIQRADQPEEHWYRQLLAVHYQFGHYTAAAGLLQQMIVLPEHHQ